MLVDDRCDWLRDNSYVSILELAAEPDDRPARNSLTPDVSTQEGLDQIANMFTLVAAHDFLLPQGHSAPMGRQLELLSQQTRCVWELFIAWWVRGKFYDLPQRRVSVHYWSDALIGLFREIYQYGRTLKGSKIGEVVDDMVRTTEMWFENPKAVAVEGDVIRSRITGP